MTNTLQKDIEISMIVEQYRKGQFSEDVAKRELRLLGCDLETVKRALGQVVLNG